MTKPPKDNESKAHADSELPDDTRAVFAAVDSVSSHLQAIEKFVARRFDELSMEINATSQQVDMAEEGIARRFAEIMEVLHAVSYSGDGSTAANAGVELDAVVDMTEQAANKILDAADRITRRIRNEKTGDDGKISAQTLEAINEDVEEIFMACSFQDITGQRIRNALKNIRMIEERLGTALDKIGIHIETSAEAHEAIAHKVSSQGDIDSLFEGSRKGRGEA